MKRLWLLMCLLLFAAPYALAAEEGDEALYLETVEVRATPVVRDTAPSRYGDSRVTVGEEQLTAQNAFDLATALSRVPGVTFSRHNVVGAYGGGEGGSIYIRGHGASRPGAEIGTLVDGIPKFSGIWTHPLLDMLPIDAAAGIEVYKSPQPVLLGNMSFGAVNLIPKRRLEEGSEGRAMAGLGSFNTWMNVLAYGAKQDDLDYYVVGAHRDSEGHRDGAGGMVDSLYARVGYQLSDAWSVSLQGHHSQSNVEDPEAEDAAAFFRPERFITDDDMAIVTLANTTDQLRGHVKLYYDDGLQDWEQWDDAGTPGDTTDDDPFDSVTDYTNYGVRARQAWLPWTGGEIVVGVDHDVFGGDFVEQHPSGPVLEVSEEMVNTAPYVMLSQEVGEVWRLTPSAGVRYNHNDNFGDELGWQAGLKLAHERLTLHAQFAHSFNYAGIYSAVLFGGTGFDTLEAEQIDHAEFGIQWRPLAGHAISVTAYQADVEDGIRVVVLPPPEYQNVGDYRTRGVELAYEAKLLPTVEIFIGGTYNDNDPEDLPYTPEWTAVAGLGWQFLDRWKFNATLSHFDEQWTGNPRSPAPNIEVDAYTLLNVRLDYRFTDRDGTRDGRFFVAGENVTDTDYELKPGYPMPGASVMTGIDVRF